MSDTRAVPAKIDFKPDHPSMLVCADLVLKKFRNMLMSMSKC